MIPGDLKAQDSIPRASLTFSWNADGDSGLPPTGPSGGAAFLQHLDTAQSVHSQATGSAPKLKGSASHERGLPSDAPSSPESVPPSVQQPDRPLVKPSRKVATPHRAIIHAKARFVGSSAGSVPTSYGVGATPSEIPGLHSCENTQAQSPRLDSELPHRHFPTKAVHLRTEWELGLPQRPIMDTPRSTESRITRSQEGSSEHHPSSDSLRPANHTFIRPSLAVLPTTSKASVSKPASASPSNPHSKGQAPFALVLDELPPKVSMEAHGGTSTSETWANPATGSSIVVATLNRANRIPQVASAMEALPPNTSYSSSTALDPWDLKHPISSEVRDAAHRAVALSQTLDAPSISEPTVRQSNNTGALRSLVLDPCTNTPANTKSELVPASAEYLEKTDGRLDSESPLALEQVSERQAPFALVLEELPPKVSMEAHGGTSTSETWANPATGSSTVVSALNRANRIPQVTSSMEALPPNTSYSSSTALDPTDLKHPISSEVRDAAHRAAALSQALDAPSISEPTVRHAKNAVLSSLVVDPSVSPLDDSNSELVPALAERLRKTNGRPDSESPSTLLGPSQSESEFSEFPENSGNSRNSWVPVTATESSFQSMQRTESGWQDGGLIPREKNSRPPSSESLANTSTTGDFELSSFTDSSPTVSQSQPQPSEPSFRSAMRSALARNPNAAVSRDTDQMSLESEKGLPTLLEPKQGTEVSMTSDNLAQGGGSDSPSSPGPSSSSGAVDSTVAPFPGAPQGGAIQEGSDGRIATPSKPEESNPSASVLHETLKPSAVRLVQLDSPGSGSLELRIQEVGEKLIIRTQDLAGSLEGQSSQWKELQQRLEASGIVLMPIEAPFSGAAAPVESQSVSADSRHTVCYDAGMGSSGRDRSDPRSSSGRARAFGESAHRDSSESPDESMKTAEALPVSRQWWA